MTVIGLTGGIASGKSTVAEQLRLLGATVIDGDRVGHRSYEPGTPGFEKVVNAFGHDVVAKDGTIDRRILGGTVFGAPEELERLNTILWPEIRRIIQDDLREIRHHDRNAIAVVEAAVLLEAGWDDLCDEVWVVTSSPKVAVDRLMSRNNLTEEQALARINAQMSARERAERADVKIDNSGDEEQLRGRVDRAWRTLLRRLEDRRVAERPAEKTAAKRAPKAPAKPAARARPAPRPAPRVAKKAATKGATARTTASRSAAPARPARAGTTASRTSTNGRSAAATARPKSSARTTTAARPAAARSSSGARAASATRQAARPAARPAKPAAKAVPKATPRRR